ncbi:MAG: cupin domain-containing protein [Actinobacteria bacterium]|nr:cupin domain-containing protein [Actinomycetota bacterium]
MRGAQEIIDLLGLEPHPEGGWFKRFWSSPETVDTQRGSRNLVTSIHYLLSAGESSRWHRIHGSQETWIWQDGGELLLRTGGSGDAPVGSSEVRLGSASSGKPTYAVVDAEQWQTAHVADGEWVLVACFVSPGFDFVDWEAL